MTFPVFASGDVLNASDMNAVGLWLVKTQTIGSGVSSVTVTGAFSADYDNYKILVNGGAASAAAYLQIQFGSTTTGYYTGGWYVAYGGTSNAVAVSNGSAGRLSVIGTDQITANFDVISPNLAKTTQFFCLPAPAAATNDGTYIFGGYQNSSTQFTAFTLLPNTGTMTGGTIRVYGYRN